MPKPKRDAIASAPPPQAQSAEGTTPDKIPTYAQRQAYLDEEHKQDVFQFTQEQERELIAEGIWPERQWSIWKHAMQRGIHAY